MGRKISDHDDDDDEDEVVARNSTMLALQHLSLCPGHGGHKPTKDSAEMGAR